MKVNSFFKYAILLGALFAFSSCSVFSPSLSTHKVQLGEAKKYVGRLKWPIEGKRKIISLFGKRNGNFHEGIDISAEEGTHIFAAHDGEVVYSGHRFSGYGNLVVIRTVYLMTFYAHTLKNAVDVGDHVNKGDYIADVGQTGNATSPHLHFETRLRVGNGKMVAVDPMAFFP